MTLFIIPRFRPRGEKHHGHVGAKTLRRTFSVLARGEATSLAISGRRSTMLCTTAAFPKCWNESPRRARTFSMIERQAACGT